MNIFTRGAWSLAGPERALISPRPPLVRACFLVSSPPPSGPPLSFFRACAERRRGPRGPAPGLDGLLQHRRDTGRVGAGSLTVILFHFGRWSAGVGCVPGWAMSRGAGCVGSVKA